jgi:hypothetical protein
MSHENVYEGEHVGIVYAYAEFAYELSTCKWWQFGRKRHYMTCLRIMNRDHKKLLERLAE